MTEILETVAGLPTFLDLPARAGKPRATGITHALDLAMPAELLDAYLGSTSRVVDILKVGWGLSYVDPGHRARVGVCHRHGVQVSTGGTLLEVAAAQGRVEELIAWASTTGVDVVEVSDGLGLLGRSRKSELIRRLATEFVVLAETGRKDGSVVVDSRAWVAEMEADLAAGARLVVAEGRESGTVGLYRPDGEVRSELVEAVVSELGFEHVIFEAPRKAQQGWLIHRLGPQVNLGNVAVPDLLPLETLRLGLRADTAGLGRLGTS